MSEPVLPIGTQISALADLAPDEPALSCDGVTLTRRELDRSTNRLARAYAERGVGVGDYVTMVLPNSIEWIQAAVACWWVAITPQYYVRQSISRLGNCPGLDRTRQLGGVASVL